MSVVTEPSPAAELDPLVELQERPASREPGAVENWLSERQKIVRALQSVDTSTWSDDRKRRCRDTVEGVLRDDRALIDELRKQQDRLKTRLQESLKQKKSLKGYRVGPEATGKTRSVKA